MENSPKKMDKKDVQEFSTDVDGISYFVEAAPFQFNDQTRYYVSVNGAEKDIFVWDPERNMFRALDDNANILPDGLIRNISDKLMDIAVS